MKSLKYTVILIALVVSCASCTKQQTYTNKKYGFSISYPNNLKSISKFGKSYLLPDYWSAIAEAKPIKSKSIISIPIISFNLDKNLSTIKPGSYYYAAVRVGISSNPKDVKKCYQPYSYYNPKKGVINGITFHKLNIEAASMSQFLSGQSYRVKRHGLCYALEFISTGSNPQNKSENKKLQRISTKARQLAIPIINSFKFK